MTSDTEVSEILKNLKTWNTSKELTNSLKKNPINYLYLQTQSRENQICILCY